MDRREFLRRSAATAAIAAALDQPAQGANIITESQFTRMKWSKAPCRFCGTGCGVKVAVRDNRVVAAHADANADVNRGLNCVKGYFLSKIMHRLPNMEGVEMLYGAPLEQITEQRQPSAPAE